MQFAIHSSKDSHLRGFPLQTGHFTHSTSSIFFSDNSIIDRKSGFGAAARIYGDCHLALNRPLAFGKPFLRAMLYSGLPIPPAEQIEQGRTWAC